MAVASTVAEDATVAVCRQCRQLSTGYRWNNSDLLDDCRSARLSDFGNDFHFGRDGKCWFRRCGRASSKRAACCQNGDKVEESGNSFCHTKSLP